MIMLVCLLLIVLGVTGFVLAVPTKEFTIDIGPMPIPAGADHHGMQQPAPLVTTLPVDGWFRGFSVELVDEQGRPIPKQLLHHINLIAPQKRELFSQIMLRLGAAGPETSPIRLPGLIGYRIHQGDTLLVTAMLHNPTTTEHQQALIRLRMAYTPLRTWLRPLAVYPFYLDVMPPAGTHAYDLPPGRSEQSWEGRPAVDGRIFGVGGHLHKYGVSLRLFDVTENRILWEAKPGTDADGNVTGMPSKYFLPLGLPLKAGHIYRATAVYENPTGAVIPDGGMGALGGPIWPTSGAPWPTIQRTDPEYQRDIAVTYRHDQAAQHSSSDGSTAPAAPPLPHQHQH